MKTNCLFLVTSLEAGGLENYLLRFLTSYNDRLSGEILCKSGKGGALKADVQSLEFKVIEKKMGYINPLNWYWFYKYLSKKSFEVVCDFTGNYAGIFLMIAYFTNVKKRVVFYRQSENRFKKSFLKGVYNKSVKYLTSKYASRILFNSEAGLNFFLGNPTKVDSKVGVIRNGLILDNFKVNQQLKNSLRKQYGIVEGSFVVGHTGRLNPAKNHQVILEIAKIIIEKTDNIFFVLIGNQTETLSKKLTSDKQKRRILLLGYKNNIESLLNLFDVFLFPSVTEGQPNSLMEAMAFGLPIIASDIVPIQETVPEYFHKLLFNPSDIEGMSKEIIGLSKNTSKLKTRTLRDYAIKNFDGKKRFKEFYNVLALD